MVKNQKELTEKLKGIDNYVYEPVERDKLPKNVYGYWGEDDWLEQFRPKDIDKDTFKEKYTIISKGDNDLALCRIYLGIKILSELIAQDGCWLETDG